MESKVAKVNGSIERRMMNEAEKSKHIDMMVSPGKWPKYPVLPLKRPQDTGGPEVGLLTAEGKPVVYLKNLFDLVTGPVKAQVEGCPKMEYDSFEVMVMDGWEVD